MVDPGEACDEPNGENADGCNEDCTISGSLLWSSTLGGTLGLTEDFFGIAVADDGRSYATGALFESGIESDFWVQQFDPDGGEGWRLVFDGPAHAADAGRAAHVAGDSLYVVGSLGMLGSGADWSVRQFSLAGAEGWSALPEGLHFGDDTPRGVAVDDAGRVYVAGHVQAITDRDVQLRQYLEGGTPGWTATHDGILHGADGARALATDGLGNVFVAGFETATGNDIDGWVAKLDASGETLWTRSHEGSADLDDLASGVAVDAQGAVYAVGYETVAVGASVGWLRKWDAEGNPLWTHTWDGGLEATVVSFLAVAVDSAGHIVLAGSEDTDLQRGIVQKLDADGSLLWSETFGDPVVGDKRLRAVAIGPGDHIWAAGRMDLGPDEDGFQGWAVRIAP